MARDRSITISKTHPILKILTLSYESSIAGKTLIKVGSYEFAETVQRLFKQI